MQNLAIVWHLLVIAFIAPAFFAYQPPKSGVERAGAAGAAEGRLGGGGYGGGRRRRSANDWLIAPNTRWCGRGNSANNTYNHLGGASAADRCCRKHDHCHASIPAMSNRYSLFNFRPYTLTHCSCDRRFRTCLKMAGDLHANTIGQMFFNVMRSQCFVLRRERLCRLRAADGSCSLYHVKQRAYVKDNKRY